MELVHKEIVDGDLAEQVWEMYAAAFEPLRTTAVQRHVMLRQEFDDVMCDPRVRKILAVDRPDSGRLVVAGAATLTQDLDAVPLISPDYFAARWPQLFAERRIWYVGFLAVHPDYHGTRAVSVTVGEICRRAAREGGLVAVDICAHNEATIKLPTLLLRLARTFTPRTSLLKLDAQTYWAFDFPEPAVA